MSSHKEKKEDLHPNKKQEEMKEQAVEQVVDVQKPNSEQAAEPKGQEVDLALENQKLREELSELKDQYLRKAADMENFRKRLQREKEEAIRYANAQLLTDVVGILDDFERAIASSQSSRDFDSFHQGIQMIESQFIALLERKYGLKRLDSLGEVFDPSLHEAIAGGGDENSVVLEVYQKGYMLHDRLLRPARVRVGQQTAQESEQQSESHL